MPQETNLNVYPYFDDYDPFDKDFHRVLFKPGYPVQARELTTLQSILQSQIERFGTHIFTDGSKVLGGELSYNNRLEYVIVENDYFGVDVQIYLNFLNGAVIVGRTSGVRAEIIFSLSKQNSFIGNATIYVKYLSPGTDANKSERFIDGEILEVESDQPNLDNEEEGAIIVDGIQRFLSAGEGFCLTRNENSTGRASSAKIESGVFFIRGYFINVGESTILLDPYSSISNYKVGLRIQERIINSDEDSSLNDNANGFSNYTAPGADRFQIFAYLDKKELNDVETNDFVTLSEIRDGEEISSRNLPRYNELANEFARRTFDESGNYYVKSPNLSIRETLNDLKGNNGIFTSDKKTYNGNTPSESLGTYVISPTKAYVMGYEIKTIGSTYIDFKKPRTAKNLQNQSVNYFTGPTYTLNNVYGSPKIGFSDYFVSLHLDRVGSDKNLPGGKEIGIARVYDFALESGSYDAANPESNQWDLSLYDIQTYTEITLNEPITLTVPTQIKGNSSGAIGYIRNDVTNSGIITAYSISGKFSIGESFTIDGIRNSRISTAVNSYGSSDVKSLYGIVGSAYTFTADVKQSISSDFGFVSISEGTSGVSTVTSADVVFTNSVKPNSVVAYTNPGNSLPTFSKVLTVTASSLTIQAVTSVAGVCDGTLPTTSITPSDFRVLGSKFQSSEDNTLYTNLPKPNVKSVDFTGSDLTIRKQFTVSVSGGSFSVSADPNETFLPFDEERYCLVNENGSTEELTQDKITFSSGSSQLTISGLSNNGNAKLIATLRKVNVTSKIKSKNNINSIIISKSKYESSGIGSTTLNDGLEYGNYPYGARVQDEEISLNESDVVRILGIYESSDVNDPEIPKIVFSSLNGPSGNTQDLILGEEFIGAESNATGVFVERNSNLEIFYTKLSSNSIIPGEILKFKTSGVNAAVSSIDSENNDVTNNYTFNNQQKNTIYDYSKIVRKVSKKEPKRKLKVIFESSSVSVSGDIVTTNSYDQFDYCNIPKINGVRNSDVIDVRPRVSNYTVSENKRSPFEFLGRSIDENNNSSEYILASDESSLLNYSFYLPRIDKIYLSKDGTFQLASGEPAENPQLPQPILGSIEIAQIDLPAYLCNLKDAKITLRDYKRYQMADIKKLEDRIKNLEYYTSLSILESNTSNLQIIDSDGLNRFKSGFFVDDFSTTKTQKKLLGSRNSIDISNSELRPAHYSTQVDLLLGSNSLSGIGVSPSQTTDAKFATDLVGSNVKRVGQLVLLDYEEVLEIDQVYSSQVANVSAYSSSNFNGTIDLFPTSDVWVDQIRAEPKTVSVEGDYVKTINEVEDEGFDQQAGFTPAVWNSWETVWTGESVKKESEEVRVGNQVVREDYEQVTKTGTSTRTGKTKIVRETFDNTSFGDQVLDSRVVPYLRSRNIEFTARRLKPFTQMYSFFDGVDILGYTFPKLVKISMISGTFQVGELVVAFSKNRKNKIGSAAAKRINTLISGKSFSCRVAKSNHKFGPYNSPTETFIKNPYNRNETLSENYSSSSEILNLDTYSLANKPQGEYYGNLEVGMVLRGRSSGATARIESLDLVTDQLGDLLGSIWVPNPNTDVNPKFEAGTKVFRLSNSSTNSLIEGVTTSSAEENYYSEGKVNTVQENILITRNASVVTEDVTETKDAQEVGPNEIVNSTVIRTIPSPTPYSPPAPSSPSRPNTPKPSEPKPAPPKEEIVINRAGPKIGAPAAERLNNYLSDSGINAQVKQGDSNSRGQKLFDRAQSVNPQPNIKYGNTGSSNNNNRNNNAGNKNNNNRNKERRRADEKIARDFGKTIGL